MLFGPASICAVRLDVCGHRFRTHVLRQGIKSPHNSSLAFLVSINTKWSYSLFKMPELHVNFMYDILKGRNVAENWFVDWASSTPSCHTCTSQVSNF